MTLPTFQVIEDDPLHIVKDVIAENDHLAKEQAYAKLSKRAKNRILFWAKLARLTEAQWLKANGWQQLEHGWWGLPTWHPKLGLGPYEQNHAANSQRHYNAKGHEVRQPPLPRRKVMFASARFEPRMLLCYSVLFTAMGNMSWWSFSLRDFIAAPIVVAALGYSVYQFRQYRRELQFEEAERLLRSTNREEPKRGNDRNRNRGR